jgi:hypothetical protein
MVPPVCTHPSKYLTVYHILGDIDKNGYGENWISSIVMIEVEQKFLLQPGEEKPLINGAVFVDTYTYTDTYWDTPDFTLMMKNRWLRQRDGKWEMKVPFATDASYTGQYHELEDEEAITTELQLARQQDLETDLLTAGYKPFCTYTTIRSKYIR